MINVPDIEQLEAFLEKVDLDDLQQTHEDAKYGLTNSAFCVSCGTEYDDDNFRVSEGCQCSSCGEVTVYPLEDLLEHCEELGAL